MCLLLQFQIMSMLSDTYIFAQLLAQVCGGILLGYAGVYAAQALRFWSWKANDERQLRLEQQNYLIGTVVAWVMVFQLVALLIFLYTTNHYLPQVIKGAMCATGALQANVYGYPALYVKIGGLFWYVVFLFLQKLDNQHPYYPLTPYKYWVLLPVMLWVWADIVLSVNYFYGITPDVITTCCSVDFSASKGVGNMGDVAHNSLIERGLQLFYTGFLLLSIGHIALGYLGRSARPWVLLAQTLVTWLWLALALWVLKQHYVKYIYGILTHHCLFDIFWFKYNGIGYLLWLGYFGAGLGYALLAIYAWLPMHLQTKLPLSPKPRIWEWGAYLGLCLAFLIPLAYAWLWKGGL
ncbi:hypothetical protein [Eisenibacter elegans]|uniref:hypothetical protein n=1 Tax=Eisenibacter elegans TaxID=997 RepID=UPI0004789B8B|nr:hypothetical protein [Eisenibacter elegans]